MAWDLQLDLQTGDLVFNAIHDLSASMAEALVQQRIHVRLFIERGGFIYDDAGQLGSRLNSLFDIGIPRTAVNVESIIRDALAPMTDIQINDIVVNTFDDDSGVVTDPSTMTITIRYSIVGSLEGSADPTSPAEFQSQVTVLA